MENSTKFVLVKQDDANQILSVMGSYDYEQALDILENGHKEFGGKLYVPKGNHDWAIEWHYGDYNGTYWSILPIDSKFDYPEYLE